MDWHQFTRAVVAAVVFGIIGILLCVLGFKAFDWILPGINVERELTENRNIAVAIMIAAVILGISAIIVAAITG